MYREDVQAVGPLDQLHRGGVTRVDLKRIDGFPLQDDIDPVDAHKAKLSSDGLNDLSYVVDEIGPLGLSRPYRSEDASAVAKAVGAERFPADQLLGDTQQAHIPTIGSKHRAAWQAVLQILLKKKIGFKTVFRRVNGDSVSAPASPRFAQPDGVGIGANGRRVKGDLRGRNAGPRKKSEESGRVSHRAQHIGTVTQDRLAAGYPYPV